MEPRQESLKNPQTNKCVAIHKQTNPNLFMSALDVFVSLSYWDWSDPIATRLSLLCDEVNKKKNTTTFKSLKATANHSEWGGRSHNHFLVRQHILKEKKEGNAEQKKAPPSLRPQWSEWRSCDWLKMKATSDWPQEVYVILLCLRSIKQINPNVFMRALECICESLVLRLIWPHSDTAQLVKKTTPENHNFYSNAALQLLRGGGATTTSWFAKIF